MASRKSNPNIMFIFSDQQRHDSLGCYGQSLPVSPNLDRMAQQGIMFRNAFTPQPVCGPARACLQTGLYATETGCFRNGIALPLDADTIARRLSKAGYEVGYIGKWHLATTSGTSAEPLDVSKSYRDAAIPPERRGGYADYWLAADVLENTSHGIEGGYMWNGDMKKVDFCGYRVDAVTDFVLEYLRTRDGSKPFFLFLSYIEPHHQNDRNRFEGPPGSREKFGEFDVPGDLEGTGGDWREQYPDYLGCCHAIDRNMKRITDLIKELGMDENTLVIYTSDHGCHFRTRNNEYKRSCHESSIHVPLLMQGPGFIGGKVIDAMVSTLDLVPTVLRAAGAAIPSYVKGQPLQDLVDGNQDDWKQEVLIQVSESQVGRAMRTPKWKYSVSAPGLKGNYHVRSNLYVEEFLYDLMKDIHEKNNLVNDPSLVAVRDSLRERLKTLIVASGEMEPEIVPANQLPTEPALDVSGRIHLDGEGLLAMDVVPAAFPGAQPIEIPLVEIIEEILDIPVLITVRGKKWRGSIIKEGAKSEKKLYLKGGNGELAPLEHILSPVFDQEIMMISLLPPGNASKHHIVIC
ncbi:sulfatase-like hydrolase/transferase [Candidatus Bathyarchaeota archaeon]|nr:sulfatase-like hydrolase/transferase [Candidatus Bathyarchaeota archaeon]